MPGEVAVGMVTHRQLMPDHVSFEHLYVEEGECPVSGVNGFFEPMSQSLPPHDASAGAWKTSEVGSGNFIDDDFAGIGFKAALGTSYSHGSFQYNVPNYWYVMKGSSIIGKKEPFGIKPGVFELYQNGDFTITRFDCAVLRGTNGVARVTRKP